MKTKRFVSTLLALLLICGLPVSAFAEEYDLATGSITVTANDSGQYVTQENGVTNEQQTTPTVITQTITESAPSTTNTVTIKAEENATANVTIQDVNIVISDPAGSPQNHSGQAAVTVNVADNASANVTLSGVNIDVSKTGGDRHEVPGEAAVQIVGNGDVTLELDGENTVQSGYERAGVEKNNTGNLTITDKNETHGSLEATGGERAAGIGGGREGDGSNITITGSAEVTANGGVDAAGIGGGREGDGSNITITGSAEVTAQGKDGGAGIGGGAYRSGSNITITGSAEVTAKGDISGAGIGGGINGSGSDITVSEDAQVKAQGGNGFHSQYNTVGTGAAIGGGGKRIDSSPDNIAGIELTPNTDELTPKGKIEYYAPGADMETDAPYKIVTGTYGLSQPAEPAQTAPLYRVINQDGKALSCETERKDGVLTITVDADIASLTGKLGGIQTLKAQGIDTIVFVTTGATSTFALSDLLSQGSTGDSYTLTHDGSTVTFTLNNGSDVSAILQ